jgi:catechol 2,3-dioxygenase-like lactoylglutathione lyase family enzyme
MENETASSPDFPTQGVELRCFLVVNDYARALAFYRDVLGAQVVYELAGTLCELHFTGSRILLSVPFRSRSDESNAPDSPSPGYRSAILDLSIQVPDCLAAYRLLRARGAEFLTPPFEGRGKTQAFFLDPDGHLIEIWQACDSTQRGGRKE